MASCSVSRTLLPAESVCHNSGCSKADISRVPLICPEQLPWCWAAKQHLIRLSVLTCTVMLKCTDSDTTCAALTGQAFAKHYNPLLSGETSHGSQYSSDKPPNTVVLRRFGEQPGPSLPSPSEHNEDDMQTATSQYTAPPSQDMHAASCPITLPALAQPTLHEVIETTIPMENAAESAKTTQGSSGQPAKQSSLGQQLSDALKLRNWKPNKPSQPSGKQGNLSLAIGAVSSQANLSLSPRTESAMLEAASELGFDNKENGACMTVMRAKPDLPPAEQVSG